MLIKGIIQEIISPYLLRIRMPSYHKIEGVNGATPNEELSEAAVCCAPNMIYNFHRGDVVIVGFEDDDLSKPIVLGYLSTKQECPTKADIQCDNFKSEGDVTLSAYTTIGDVMPESIACLRHQKDNIPESFQLIKKELKKLADSTNNLDTISRSNSDEIGLINISLSALSSRITALETKISNLDSKFGDYIKRYPTVFSDLSYGSDVSEIKNPQEGQIYFTIKGDK